MKLSKEELKECLTTLKEQAREFGDNTFLVNIKLDSFNYVMDLANKELEQKTKTGYWEKLDGYGYGLTDRAFICKCSECGDTVWCYLGSDREWKYCPSCGVKMIHSKEVKEC